MGNYLTNYTPWRTITISEKLYDCNGAIGRLSVMVINEYFLIQGGANEMLLMIFR